MTTFTSPTTDAEKAKYSRHALEIFCFGMAAACFQMAWAFLDWPAYSDFFAAIFHSKFPELANGLAIGLLIALHVALAVTFRTYCWMRHDDDDKTNYPIAIPIVMAVLLLGGSIYGTNQRGKALIEKPVAETADRFTADRNAEIGRIDADKQSEIDRITKDFDTKIRAATDATAREIANWNNREVISDNDRAFVRRGIATAAKNGAAKVDVLENKKSAALAEATDKAEAKKAPIEARHGKLLDLIDSKNERAESAYRSSLGQIGFFAYLLSPALCLLFFAITNRRIQLLCQCGIKPTRKFNVIAKNGGWIGVLGNALSDALSRQMYRLSIFLHQKLITGTEHLKDFDASVVETSFGYQAVEDPFQKVANKMAAAKIALDSLTPEQKLEQLEMAATMNGSYKNAPLPKNDQRDGLIAAQPVVPLPPISTTPPPAATVFPVNCATVPITVAQTDMTPDDYIAWKVGLIRKEPSHFDRVDANNATVARRIFKHLDDLLDRAAAPDWKPSRLSVQQFRTYYDDQLAKSLLKAGQPYLREDELQERFDFVPMTTGLQPA